MRAWRDARVWAAVAGQLREYREDGFGGLLTQDSVRFCAARALVAAGADVAGLRVEVPHPAIKGARLDLAVGWPAPSAVVEVKYPREPNPAAAAWTMALGEVLKDFYRLAAYPGDLDRLFLYAEGDDLRRYLVGAADRYGVDLHADAVDLNPESVAALPTTAANIIGSLAGDMRVTADRLALLPVDDSLRLAVYLVAPCARQVEGPVVNGARAEILEAVRAILTRSGGRTFTPAEVVAEMGRRGTRYAESTIRTMVTAHLCRNAPDNAGTTYQDFERADRGLYRLAT